MNAILLPLLLLFAEPIDIGEITATEGLRIQYCHPDARALVEIEPLHPDARHVPGRFSTTNELLVLTNLSMLPGGTNLARVRIVCDGATSEVSVVQFVIRRPMPGPPVRRGKLLAAAPNPPMPFAALPITPSDFISPKPLPSGTNETYRALINGLRRSQ